MEGGKKLLKMVVVAAQLAKPRKSSFSKKPFTYFVTVELVDPSGHLITLDDYKHKTSRKKELVWRESVIFSLPEKTLEGGIKSILVRLWIAVEAKGIKLVGAAPLINIASIPSGNVVDKPFMLTKSTLPVGKIQLRISWWGGKNGGGTSQKESLGVPGSVSGAANASSSASKSGSSIRVSVEVPSEQGNDNEGDGNSTPGLPTKRIRQRSNVVIGAPSPTISPSLSPRRSAANEPEGVMGARGRQRSSAHHLDVGSARRSVGLSVGSRKNSRSSVEVKEEDHLNEVSLPPHIQRAVDIALQDKDDVYEKLKKELEALSGELEGKVERTSKMEEVLMRYRDLDDEAQALTGGDSIDWEEMAEMHKNMELGKSKEDHSYEGKELDPQAKTHAEFLDGAEALNYLSVVKRRLGEADAVWMKSFVQCGGLNNIYTLLAHVENLPQPSIDLHLKQVELASFLTSLLNNQAMCEYILRNKAEVIQQLVILLVDSRNKLLQVRFLPLVAALCLYGRVGYDVVKGSIDSNPNYYYRLVQLLLAEEKPQLISPLLSVINALIAGEKILEERMKVRAHFSNSDIHDVIDHLRTKFPSSEALLSQIKAFEEQEKKDEGELRELKFIGNISLGNSRQIFEQLLVHTDALDLNVLFLRHLQQLMLFSRAESPITCWKFIDRVSRTVTSKNQPLCMETLSPEEIHQQIYRIYLIETTRHLQETSSHEGGWQKAKLERKAGNPRNGSPLLTGAARKRDVNDNVEAKSSTLLSSKSKFARPKRQVRTPASRGGRRSTRANAGNRPSLSKTPDSEGLQDSFTINETINEEDELDEEDENNKDTTSPPPPPPPVPAVYDSEDGQLQSMLNDLDSVFVSSSTGNLKTKKKKISFLPLQISNNISILRKQFKQEDSEIISELFDIEHSAEKFQTHHFEAILAAIPDAQYMKKLSEYNGDVEELETPDRFALFLWRVPMLKEKVKALIFWDEFDSRIANLESNLNIMFSACNELLESKKLKKILAVILSIGNFLNQGSAIRGCARAFLPHSLRKLSDVKATNQGNVTLLTFLSGFIDTTLPEIVDFEKEVPNVLLASRYEVNIIDEELESLEEGLGSIMNQLDTASQEEMDSVQFFQYYDAMTNFSEYCRGELDRMSEVYADCLEKTNLTLEAFGYEADYPIEKVWGSFANFIREFNKALKEHHKRKDDDNYQERIARRQQARLGESFDSLDDDLMPTSGVKKNAGIMDRLIGKIEQGKFEM